MILSSGTKKPKIHSSAYVAPTATISGDVTIGAGCAVLHGAVVAAEGAPISIGADTVVMENAVIKSSGGAALQWAASIGERCIIGPQSYIVGAKVGDGSLVASGARIYNGIALEGGTRVAPNEVRRPDGDFFETVFNLPNDADVAAVAAESYAKFLRKAHAQDARVGDGTHTTKGLPPRRSAGEEPPQQQMAQVDGVVDAMMLELQEMEHRRAESKNKAR